MKKPCGFDKNKMSTCGDFDITFANDDILEKGLYIPIVLADQYIYLALVNKQSDTPGHLLSVYLELA